MSQQHGDADGRPGVFGRHAAADHDSSGGSEQDRRPLDQTLMQIERREILSALRKANGQRTLAAQMLGISRSRLYRRMEALGIDPREARSQGRH